MNRFEEWLNQFSDDQQEEVIQYALDHVLPKLRGKKAAEQQASKPLTDEQIEQAVKTYGVTWTGYREDEQGFYTIPVLSPYHYKFARAIEAAHGITALESALGVAREALILYADNYGQEDARPALLKINQILK